MISSLISQLQWEQFEQIIEHFNPALQHSHESVQFFFEDDKLQQEKKHWIVVNGTMEWNGCVRIVTL